MLVELIYILNVLAMAVVHPKLLIPTLPSPIPTPIAKIVYYTKFRINYFDNVIGSNGKHRIFLSHGQFLIQL